MINKKLLPVFIVLSISLISALEAFGCDKFLSLKEGELEKPTKVVYFLRVISLGLRKRGFYSEVKLSELGNYRHYNKVMFVGGLPKKIESYDANKKNTRVITFDDNGLLEEDIVYPHLVNGEMLSCVTNESTSYEQVCTKEVNSSN